MEDQDKKEIKRQWKFFLFYGLAIIVIGTLLQYGLNHWLDSKSQGPPCRIDFFDKSFKMTNSTDFSLSYLFINLRDKDLLIDKTEAYCYWKPNEQQQNDTSIPIQPIINNIPAPRTLESFPSLKSDIKTSSCRSPPDLGKYPITIIVKTNQGECKGYVEMEVVKE